MSPLNIIYWIKVALGFFTAILCILLGVNNIIGGAALSMAVYVLSDKILRQIFIAKVNKPSDITKTGIMIYILSWIFFWALLYTLLSSI